MNESTNHPNGGEKSRPQETVSPKRTDATSSAQGQLPPEITVGQTPREQMSALAPNAGLQTTPEVQRTNYSAEGMGRNIVLFPSSRIAFSAARTAETFRRAQAMGYPYDPSESLYTNNKNLTAAQNMAVGMPLDEEIAATSLEEVLPVEQFMAEYRAMVRAIAKAVGGSVIQLVEFSSRKPYLHKSRKSDAEIETAAEETDTTFPRVKATFGEKPRAFPRDYYTQFGDQIFLSKRASHHTRVAMRKDGYKVEICNLGEGGAVLSADKSVIVSDFVWEHTEQVYFNTLRQAGYTISRVPNVRVAGQPEDKKDFATGHIDGHASLVVDPRTGEKTFLYASSYARQDAVTTQELTQAANDVGAIPLEVDDDTLSPLAFNFIQFPNGKVVCPRGGIDENGSYVKSTLEVQLERIVGAENLILTDIPIRLFPRYTQGGMRCLTNISSPELLAQLTR